MRKTIIFIGCTVVAVLVYSVPILLACSFLLNWDNFAKFIFTLAAIAELVLLDFKMAWKVDGEDND